MNVDQQDQVLGEDLKRWKKPKEGKLFQRVPGVPGTIRRYHSKTACETPLRREEIKERNYFGEVYTAGRIYFTKNLSINDSKIIPVGVGL